MAESLPMRALRNLPIKRKLMIIAMLSSGVALFLACLMFMSYEVVVYRSALISELESAARIIGDNSAAALSFDDPNSAEQTLSSLTTHPHVVDAAIFNAQGKLFARYQRSGLKERIKAPTPEAAGHRFDDSYVMLFHDIELAGEKTGSVYIRSDLSQIRERMARYLAMVLLVLVVSSGFAFLLSHKLQAAISAPISHLAGIVEQVGASKDYGLRAAKQGDDEMGRLIDGFNEMLGQIQRRDAALQEARENLERRIEERTHALAESLSLINATLESSPDGIAAMRFDGGTVCYNTLYKTMWNMPDAMLEKAEDASQRVRWIADQLKSPESFLKHSSELSAATAIDSFEVLALNDGRIIERYAKPQMVEGKAVGIVVSFRDVTARKQAERELEMTHRQLLETSRQAGMAEVATGVLHNVGNVLNSVNVSANLLTESAKNSKVGSMEKLLSLLREHEQDLGAFISADARGKHLPAFLVQVAEQLLLERQGNLKELESLRNNIDHIKQIVSMQQSYSKISGVREVVSVVDLIEDSLRLNEGALQRHGVEVERQYEARPTLNIEKHKVLQVLVNLVRNAKHACCDFKVSDKRIVLRITEDNSFVHIAVIDNGIGIAPENLTRIFGHGFTTRKDGHGFGLHSGALAARELGGSLQVHSEGHGLGATFTLTLPLKPAKDIESTAAA